MIDREAIRARSSRAWGGRNNRTGEAECTTGHAPLFATHVAYDLDRQPEGGGYPVGLVELAARLMGVTRLEQVVHLCSGSVRGPLTFDVRAACRPAVVADVRILPIRSSSTRWVMADPPYGPDYARELWDLEDVYPTPTVLLREACRILAPGGRVAFLHHIMPALPDGLERLHTIGVTTGAGYRIRALTIAERVEPPASLFA